MSVTDHDRWVDSAGAYVLGAMAPRERDEYEVHLATCAICREEVDELRPAAEALPMASPPVLPPPALKDRIMAEVEREAALLAPSQPSPPRRRFRFPSLSGWRLAPVAAALLIAGALVGALLRGGEETASYRAGPNAEVRVENDRGTLVAENLGPPPAGKVYEVWVMPKGAKQGDPPKPTNVLFVPRSDGSAEAAIPGSMADIQQVLVSAEPPGGSAAPTSDPVLSATTS